MFTWKRKKAFLREIMDIIHIEDSLTNNYRETGVETQAEKDSH